MHLSTLLVLSFVYTTLLLSFYYFFFFNDTATTEIYTLSLHDALPISGCYQKAAILLRGGKRYAKVHESQAFFTQRLRSEEHTSELQSRLHLVCRLLLEKKKNNQITEPPIQ